MVYHHVFNLGFPDTTRASLIAHLVKHLPAMQETLVLFLGWEDLLRRARLPTPVFLGFSCGSAGKESNCNVGHLGLTLGLGGSPGEGKGHPLQHSGLENSMGSQRVGHDRVTPTFHNTNNMEILFLYVFALCLW